MKTVIKRGLVLASLVAFSMGAIGCNTLRGVGQDVENGGEAIQDAATDD